jgi:hypothetical protein
MCIIMAHEAGKQIPDEYLDISAINHPHGCGLSYVHEGKVHVKKEMSPAKFKKVYKRVLHDFPQSNIIVHYRKMTDGSVNLNNCHPFRIDADHVFAHNGTIYPCKPHKDAGHDKSDTYIFNEEIMKKLPEGWFDNKIIWRLLDEFIGRSKLAIMRSDNKILLIGEKKGTADSLSGWDEGVWYSNQSYKDKKKETVTYPAYSYGSHRDYSNEWKQEGLSMRYNNVLRETEAWDHDSFRWRTYNTLEGRFDTHPYTCKLHAPDAHKPFYKEWKFLTENTTKPVSNLVLLPPRPVSLPDRTAKCDVCQETFNDADLELIGLAKSNDIMEVCSDCLLFYKSINVQYSVIDCRDA